MSRQLADASESAETSIETTLEAEKASFLKQPKAVWATALAAVFAFMGIGQMVNAGLARIVSAGMVHMISSGALMKISAGSKLQLACGGSKITLTPGSVKIEGPRVDIGSSGNGVVNGKKITQN